MKITRVSFEKLNLKLSEPYHIAYESVHNSTNFILKIETNKGITGYGCAAPDPLVTGEIPEHTGSLIEENIIPFLKGKDPFTYARILFELNSSLEKKSSVLAMVDMALHDIMARKAGLPLYKLLGGFRNCIPTSITIGILPLEDTLRQATEFVHQGFSILKIKGGKNLDEDIEKMIRLRESNPNIVLRFDGNQGYSVEEAIHFVKETTHVGVEIFEQPIAVRSDRMLHRVTSQVHIPVMADESLKTLKDAFDLAQNEHVDMVNIKLMKVGGILEGMHINSVAKSAGLEVMVGCIDECALGISAGLHFALARPNIHYADLDGHFDMVNDPFSGLFELKNGVLFPSEHPGLGKISI